VEGKLRIGKERAQEEEGDIVREENICLIVTPAVTGCMWAQEVVAHSQTELQSWKYFPLAEKVMQIILFQIKLTALMIKYPVNSIGSCLTHTVSTGCNINLHVSAERRGTCVILFLSKSP
jgi:hypothetical protein